MKHFQGIAANHGNTASTQATKHHARKWLEGKMVSKGLNYN